MASEDTFWTQVVNSRLVRSWRQVLGELLTPFPFISLVATGSLIAYQSKLPSDANPGLNNLLSLMIAIFGGIVGSQLFERWKQINEQSALAVKGRSAVRSLNLVLRRVTELERLVSEHETIQKAEKQAAKAIVPAALAELRRSANSIAMQVVGAIEEWEDIVPEAKDLQTRIDIFAETQQQLLRSEEKVENLHAELTQILAESSQEIEEGRAQISILERRVNSAEKERDRLRAELAQQRSSFGTVSPTINTLGSIQGFTFSDRLLSGTPQLDLEDINNLIKPDPPPISGWNISSGSQGAKK
jgi:hypothetical protein